jgi:hypothetical protein
MKFFNTSRFKALTRILLEQLNGNHLNINFLIKKCRTKYGIFDTLFIGVSAHLLPSPIYFVQITSSVEIISD